MTTWKQFERDVAKLFGSRRNPLSGPGNTDDHGRPRTGDIIHDDLEIECKMRKTMAVFRWWERTAADAKRSGRTPVLFLREKGNRRQVLVTVSAEYFMQLYRSYKMRPGTLPPNQRPPNPQRKRIPKSELRPGPERTQRRCNICHKEVYLRRYERFCTPCREATASEGGVRKGRLRWR